MKKRGIFRVPIEKTVPKESAGLEKAIENGSGEREGSGKGNTKADEILILVQALLNYVGVDLVKLVLGFARPEKG